MLTGGQVADCIAADQLLDQLVSADILHADKGYDSDAVRQKIESKGAAPNIPPKVNRRWKNCFSPYLYRQRNAIERMFGRLKDFRPSPRVMTVSRATSSPQSASLLPSATGYESGA
jgi:transposase